jgi:hypothetical protein
LHRVKGWAAEPLRQSRGSANQPFGGWRRGAQEHAHVINHPEVIKPRMVTIEISGKKYEVPEGITVISDEMMLRHMG